MADQQPEFREIALSQLRFDPDNPRFPSSVDGNNVGAILDFMLKDAGLLELIRSISSQGFFPGEPILVAPLPLPSPSVADSDEESDVVPPQWVVVEGNRRLAASTLIANPGLAPRQEAAVGVAVRGGSRVDTIPCLIFQNRNEILQHLGYRHVTGIKEWDPLAKARFLRERYDDLDKLDAEQRLKSVARSIGSRSDYVGRLLTAFGIFRKIEENHYFNLTGVSEKSISFSLITSALAYADIVAYLKLSSSQDLEMSDLDLIRLQFLTKAMFEKGSNRKTQLGESRNLRKLADVLAVGGAEDLLLKGVGLEQAWKVATGGAGAFRSFIQSATENVEYAEEEVSGTDFDDSDVELLDGLQSRVVGLRGKLVSIVNEAH